MNEIITMVKQAFINGGAENVFSAYDSIPVRSKGSFFVVIGISSYEAMDPIYSDTAIYMPVKADLTIDLLAPEKCSAEEIYNYFEEKIESSLNGMCGLNSRLRSIVVSRDSELCRMRLRSVIKVSCMKTIPR